MSTTDTKVAESATDIAAASDTGGRSLTGSLGFFVALLAFVWACFQLYIASGVPFWLTQLTGVNAVFNEGQSRIVHLASAMAKARCTMRCSMKVSHASCIWLSP